MMANKANLVYLKREYAMSNPIIPWQECPSYDCRQRRAHNLFCDNSGVKHPVHVPRALERWLDDVDPQHPDLIEKRQMEAE